MTAPQTPPPAQPPAGQQPPPAPTQPVDAPWGAPAGSPPAQGAAPAPSGGGVTLSLSSWAALAAVVATVLAVAIKEDGYNGFKDVAVWSTFAIVASVLTLAPLVRSTFKWTEQQAWYVAAAGAGGLAAFWVLIVLPSISRNTSFLATLGLAAAGLAVWTAPGKPDPDAPTSGPTPPTGF